MIPGSGSGVFFFSFFCEPSAVPYVVPPRLVEHNLIWCRHCARCVRDEDGGDDFEASRCVLRESVVLMSMHMLPQFRWLRVFGDVER